MGLKIKVVMEQFRSLVEEDDVHGALALLREHGVREIPDSNPSGHEFWLEELEYRLQMALEEEEKKIAVWNKGERIRDRDPGEWRRDSFGRVMRFSMYGNRKSKYGWEIDHIRRQRHDGSDALSNLRPLNWLSNAKRG